MKSLVCPHCQSVVDQNASVCLGCGAEVVRGASRKEKLTVGCLSTCIGVLITMVAIGSMVLPSIGPPNEMGLAVLLGILLSALVFNVLGRLLASLLFRSRLRFFRTYQHR